MPSSQLNTHDAYGRLLLTAHIKQILTGLGPPEEQHEMATGVPAITFSTALSPLSEDDTSGKNERKLTVLRKLRPPPFKYAWNFFHDKHSTGANYEGRLTLMLDNIVTVKPFWEAFNQFPLEALQLKDSVHFFKRGVKPVWEDPRNVKGGGWTFRVPKAKSAAFWKEVLILAVGEQFVDVIQPGDDLCGLSLSVRFNSDLVTIWNRDGSNEKTKEGILAVVLEQISPELKPQAREYYYKKHSQHAGFSEVVARANEKKADDGKITEAEVRSPEGDEALLREAEGLDLKDLAGAGEI